MNTLAFCRGSYESRPYFALAHTAAAPDAAEWLSYVQAVARCVTESQADVTVHSFVVTDGGGPNAAQRRELAEAFNSGVCQAWTHVFTEDAFVRGIVTAFRWIARANATAHAPSEFADLCREYAYAPTVVLADLLELQRELPPLHVLSRIQAHVPRDLKAFDRAH